MKQPSLENIEDNRIPFIDRLLTCGPCLVGSGVIAMGYYEIMRDNSGGAVVVGLGAAVIALVLETQREASILYK